MTTHSLEDLRRRIQSLQGMPTVPVIVQPLVAMLQQPAERVDLEKIVELVSRDSGIAAQCLRIVSSPLFGRRNTETVRSAVLALGIKRVEAILLSCCLNQVVPSDRWAFDAATFWRHSLGCALVCGKLAQLVGYPDPEKAYLAGLLHDLGILVNTFVYTNEFRDCIQAAQAAQMALELGEQEHLGFTHAQSGKILAEHWHFSAELVEVIEFHHQVQLAPAGNVLVALVHLSDLLCRLRDLGYGYYEAMGVELAGDEAWGILLSHFPELAKIDLARLTMDIDGAMDEIISVVDAVFKRQS